MYCLKCRRVTETENINIAISKNCWTNEARSMHHMLKTNTHFVKKKSCWWKVS